PMNFSRTVVAQTRLSYTLSDPGCSHTARPLERLDTLPTIEDRAVQAHRLAVHGCDRLVAHRDAPARHAARGPLDPGGSDLTLDPPTQAGDLQPEEPSLSSLPGTGPGHPDRLPPAVSP